MRLKRVGGILLPKDHPQFDIIERDLNRVSLGFNGELVKMVFYEDVGDDILIPRFYPVDDEIEDLTSDGVYIDIEADITPRNKRQEKSIDLLVNNLNGLLSCEPGMGKTICAIAAISKIKKRTIIFAHKVKLLEQWKSEFLNFTDLTEDDIGKLSTKNYDKVFKKKIILCTEHIIPYAIKHKNKEFLEALHNSGIGIAVIDEVHVGIGPQEFSKTSLHLTCKRMYGLSATPFRNDGNEDIIKYHVGETTYFEPEEGEILNPLIHIICFPFGVYNRYRKYISWGGKFSLPKYLKQMVKADSYINNTSKLVKKCYDNKRITLILGERKLVLLELAKKCGVPKEDIGIFIPGTNSKERLSVSNTDELDVAFHKKKVIFATYLAARDGNNRKDLDCLIHSTPSTNVEQSIGRIQRQLDGKPTPIVIDLVDTEGPSVNSIRNGNQKAGWFIRKAEQRMIIYKEKGWEIKTTRLRR